MTTRLNRKKEFGKEQKEKRDGCTNNYTRFFMEKDSKKMILYDEFPSLGEILDYYWEKSFLAEHPIEEYGKFEIRELLEVIKYLYSFYYGQEYQIITFGYLERRQFVVQEGMFEELKPKLCFIVGTDPVLDEYRKYQNLFLESEQKFDFSKKRESMIVLHPMEGTVQDTLGICCKGEGLFQNTSGVCYFDYLVNEYKRGMYLEKVSLFDSNFYQKIRGYLGIEDTLWLRVHSNDRFLAKALISIVIYKKNHEKVKLSDQDYQNIFYQLFQDNSVHISRAIEKEIPKTLKYVPR